MARVRGRWTIEQSSVVPSRGSVWGPITDGEVEVVPAPDEQAIERAAKVLFGESYQLHGREEVVEEHWPLVSEDVRRFSCNRARAVLAAALEQSA